MRGTLPAPAPPPGGVPMPLFDLSRTALETYLPDIDEPADFDAFWATTLAEAQDHDLALKLTRVDSGLCLIDVFDVEFAGFGGHLIKAWLTRPLSLIHISEPTRPY